MRSIRILLNALLSITTGGVCWADTTSGLANNNVELQLYGYIKLDAVYDSSRIDSGNYAKWVEFEGTNKNDDQFNMTARQTRIGMKIREPKGAKTMTSGLIEMDFYGNGSENKPGIMMRHAYLKIDWPEERFDIIVGQTSDIISPLCPSTLNYTVAWWAGNIGYRRPQIRLTKSFALNSSIELKLEGGLARTIGLSGEEFSTPGDAGEDAGFPGMQARTSVLLPLFADKPTVFGVSGHWAQEELDITAYGDVKNFDSWSVNLDLALPIDGSLTIRGELFTGGNLSAYLGGIGQGINTVMFEEIESSGGWVAADFDPSDEWKLSFCVSLDDVDENDVATGSRTFNRSVLGNVIYSINQNTQIGFELSQWHTEYKDQQDASSWRGQASFIYKF